MPTVVIEGWRFLPHSYSLWAMYLSLELSKHPELTVHFRDARMPDPTWRPARGVLSGNQEEQIAALPSPPDGLIPDLLVRIVFPYDFAPSAARRTFILGTTEYGIVPATFMAGGEPVSKAALRTGFTIGTPTRWSMEGFLRSGVKAKQLCIAPNGIDPDIFRPADDATRAAIRRERGWDGKFILFHNSSLGWNKNLEMMLDATLELADELPDLRLVLKGMDALYGSTGVIERVRAQLPAPAKTLLASRIEYIGESMSIDQVARLYQGADAYVCPYLAEGFNMPALEAAACGLPVICTAGGSTDDFMRPEFSLKIASKIQVHRETGGKALQPNYESYLAHIRRVVRDAAFRAGARSAGPTFAHAGWTWKHAADRLLAAASLS